MVEDTMREKKKNMKRKWEVAYLAMMVTILIVAKNNMHAKMMEAWLKKL